MISIVRELKVVFCLGLLLSGFVLHCQNFEGRILNADGDVANVHVLNLTSDSGTITNEAGYFNLSAKEGDTIQFSAVQFTRKELVVSPEMLDGFVLIRLSPSLTELEEVVVWPFMLSGELLRDLDNIEVNEVISASSIGLPNAEVRKTIQSEKLLYTARTWDFRISSIKLDPLINAISGRTKMLNKRVARDIKTAKYNEIYREFDSIFIVNELRIPSERINDFYYYCEADPAFDSIVKLNVQGEILEYIVNKSDSYKQNNGLK